MALGADETGQGNFLGLQRHNGVHEPWRSSVQMKAAQLLYGDNVGGAIVPEEEGDILMKLAREALGQLIFLICNRCCR